MDTKLLSRSQLTVLIDAGLVRDCTVRAIGGEFYVFFGTKTVDYQLAKQRKAEPRPFRTIDAACTFVRDAGLGRLTVDIAQWQPQQKQLPVSAHQGG